MDLNIKTLQIAYLTINFLLLTLFFIYYQSQKTYPGFGLWVISLFILILSYSFYPLRDIIPDFLSYNISNIFVISTVFLRLEALKQFHQNVRGFSLKINLSIFLIFAACIFLVSYWSGSPIGSPIKITLRSILLTIILLFFFTQIILILLKIPQKNSLPKLMIIFTSFFFLLFALKTLTYLLEIQETNLFSSSLINSLFFLFIITTELSHSIVFVLMQSQRASSELAQANLTKDKFFSIISHDLKGPISSLYKLSEMLAKGNPSLKDAHTKEILSEFFHTSKQTYFLLENLLNWSRSQTGEIQINKTQFDISIPINLSIALYEKIAQNKEIIIESQIQKNTIVSADLNMVSNVIRNLISNAIKFTRRGGKIYIASSFIKKNLIQILFQDNGIGISPEKLNKLFKINEKTQGFGTENEEGNGIGLILCKDFIEKNGGAIRVESEVNQGSRFYITIPAAEKQTLI